MPYDINNDGVISDQELEVYEFHRETIRWQTQRKMAWVAMVSMIVYTIALFLPVVPDARVQVLVEIAPLFYVAQAGVVGAYMGSKAAVDKNMDNAYRSMVPRHISQPKGKKGRKGTQK